MLVDGERGEEPPALWDVADSQLCDLVRRLPDELLAAEANRAGDPCGRQADDRVAERRLAHAVPSDDRGRAAGDLERDVFERLCPGVIRVDALDREQGVSHRSDTPGRVRGRAPSGWRGSRRACL